MIFQKAFGGKIDMKKLKQFSLFSLYSWLAYSFYDELLDKKNNHSSNPLSQAFFFLVFKCLESLPLTKEARKEAWYIFYLMEEANYLEKTGKSSKLWLKSAHKSLGHSLIPLWLAPARARTKLKKFFLYYLSLKQINDDALDWEEDLKLGHHNPIIRLLRKQRGKGKNTKDLRKIFKNKTSPLIKAKLKKYYLEAKKIILNLPEIKNKKIIIKLIEKYKVIN